MSNYQTVICIGDTSIYKVPEIKEFFDTALLAAAGFFASKYDAGLAAEMVNKAANSNCENSKFIIKALRSAGEFVIYGEEYANKLSTESFHAILEHEKAHIKFQDLNNTPESYLENIDQIELRADKYAASIVGKEAMKEALKEIIKINTKNLMANRPNGRSFEDNFKTISESEHFKLRFDALS